MKYNNKPSESKLSKLRKDNPKLYDQIATSQMQTMKHLNDRIAVVRIGGKVRFVLLRERAFNFYSHADMTIELADVPPVLDWNGKHHPAFKWWVMQDDRNHFDDVIFEPDLRKVPEGALNLFRGFKHKPKPKEDGWSVFADHLLNNVCQGDQANYDYLLDIFAHLVQRPGAKVGIAPVIVGSKGCGKSVVGEIIAEMIGPEYTVSVDTPEALTGRFNSHIARALLVRIEEAMYAKDLRHSARIKHYLTSNRILVELKRVDAIEMESKANFLFTSNNRHVVAATASERRFFCLECGTARQQDGAYFAEMKAQLQDGGYAALMFDLLARDISRTNFQTPPRTKLLAEQMVESMTGLEAWWRDALRQGGLPFTRLPDAPVADLEWPDDGCEWLAPKALVVESAAAYARDHAGRPPSPEAVGKFLAEAAPGLVRTRRQMGGVREHIYILPPLATCRAAFVQARPGLTLADVTSAVREVADHTGALTPVPAGVLPRGGTVVPLRA